MLIDYFSLYNSSTSHRFTLELWLTVAVLQNFPILETHDINLIHLIVDLGRFRDCRLLYLTGLDMNASIHKGILNSIHICTRGRYWPGTKHVISNTVSVYSRVRVFSVVIGNSRRGDVLLTFTSGEGGKSLHSETNYFGVSWYNPSRREFCDESVHIFLSVEWLNLFRFRTC